MRAPRRPIDSKGAAVLFIVGQSVLVLSIVAAICLYPGFSLWDDSLSDLGMASTAPLFNGGLIVGGVLSVVFYGSLWVSEWRSMGMLRKAGAVLQPVSMLFMLSIGVFTETFGMFHFYIAVCFYALLLGGTLLLGISMARDPAVQHYGVMAFVIFAAGAVSWNLGGDGLAVPEIISAAPAFLWMSGLALRRLRTFSPGGDPRRRKSGEYASKRRLLEEE